MLRGKVVGQNLGGNRGGDQSRLSAAASHLSSGHFTRTEYNQLTIGIDDMRASDEGTKGSADQVVDRLGSGEGAVFTDGDSDYVFRCSVWTRRTGQDDTGND